MKNIIKSISIILLAAAALATAPLSDARVKAKRGKGKKAATEAPARKKTPYEKFVSAKGTVKYPGTINLYLDKKGSVWAEFPDSLVGRYFIFSAISRSKGDAAIPDGQYLTKGQTLYKLEKRDSIVMFTTSGTSVHPEDASDSGVVAAIASSCIRTIFFKSKVKHYNSDSTSFVTDITKILEPGDKNVSIKGMPYGNYPIYTAKYNKELSGKPSLINKGSSIGMLKEAVFKDCQIAAGMFTVEIGSYSCNIQTSLTLVPKADPSIVHKVADSRIGTVNMKRTVFDADGKLADYYRACRWDLSGDRKITVYIDTLLPSAIAAAAQRGILAWNEAFEAAGLGRRIQTLPLPSGVDPDSPLTSCVKFCGGAGSSMTSMFYYDEDGRILSMHINIPTHFAQNAMQLGRLCIADVDSRFAQYEINESAVADVIAAHIMSMTGHTLGLADNPAGSRAYSPAQLRDPGFTAANGFTASVTDDVTFNYLARPGDKERGVKLISDRIGEYDRYAIAWLYGNGAPDEKVEHRFVPSSRNAITDARGIVRDLGNDIIAAYEAGTSHTRYAAEHAVEWYGGDNVPEDVKQLSADFIYIRHFYLLWMLRSQIGGLSINEMRQGSGLPKYEAVPEDIQSKCTEKMLDFVEDQSYFDKCRNLLLMCGANRNTSDYTRLFYVQYLDIRGTLPKVLAAEKLAGSTYTATKYMDQVEKGVLREIRSGHLKHQGEFPIQLYISQLASCSPLLNSNYEKGTHPLQNRFTADLPSDLRADVKTIPATASDEAELYAYRYLERLSKALKEAKASFSGNDREKMEYLIFLCDSALGKFKK